MATSAELASQIQQYDQNKVTSTDALNEALKQYGVPEIRNTVSGLRTTLANTQSAYNAVDPSVTGRTQGSLVTEAQRTKQVANERAPIAGQISDQGKALGDQTTALNEALGQATTQANNRVNDYNTGRAALQNEYDTTYGREQDTAKAEAQRQAAAQSQANEDRNYQLQLAASNRAGAKTAAPTKQDVTSHIVGQLNSLRGRDGYVSNETWANALNDFTTAGGTTRQFFQNYSQYVNPKFKTSYAGWANR